MVPSGLYARLCHAFLVYLFLMVEFIALVSCNLMDQFSSKFRVWQMDEGLVNLIQLLLSLKGRCHCNQLKSKNWCFSWTNLLCSTAIPKRIAISQFLFQNIKKNEILYIVYNFRHIWSRNSRVYTVNNKKHLKNVGPIHHCEPPHALILHCHSPGVATVARLLHIDVHDNDNNNDNA